MKQHLEGPSRGGARLLVIAATIAVVLAGLAAGSIAAPTGASRVPRSGLQPRDTSGLPRPAQVRPGAQPTLPTTGPAWTFIGPRPVKNPTFGGLDSGRVTSLTSLPGSPLDVYAGTADGGVWKSTNQGGTWIPLLDKAGNLSVGSLASDTTSQAVYVGTGEDNFNSDAVPGVGILRLVNTTVTNVASNLAGATIGGIAVDRTTAHASLRLFAATSLGLYGSTGGGTGSWKANTGFASAVAADDLPPHATGVVQDATVATKFFTAVGNNCANGLTSAAILASTDKGVSWSPVLTAAPASRITVASGPKNTEWAIAAQCDGTIYNIWKSTLGGAAGSWKAIPATLPYDLFNPNGGNGQGWYDIAIGVDPTNASRAVFEGVDAFATADGGKTVHPIGKVYSGGVVHPDFHAILFTGANSFYAGNDGGVWSTSDLGGTGTAADWQNLNNTLGTTQFYSGSALDSANAFGGAQDNGNSGFFNGPRTAWPKYTIAGDGFFTAIDYTVGSDTIYGEYFNLGMLKGSSADPAMSDPISPCVKTCASADFSAPFVLDPTYPKRLLAGTTDLWESKAADGHYTGGGSGGTASWTDIGKSLTYGVAHRYPFHQTDAISSISVAPKGESNVIYTLSAQGRAFRTLDDKHFTDVTGNLPPANPAKTTNGWPWGSQIAVNPWNTDEAWVAITGSKIGHVWHTDDGGSSWRDVTGNLGDRPVSSVLVDPRQKNTIYIGAGDGVYVCSTCGGGAPVGTWEHYGTGLPGVWVTALTLTRDTKRIVAWTHGRSAWTVPTSLPPGTAKITEFPTAGATTGIANGPNGVWFTEGAKVGVAGIDGTVKEFSIPGASQLQDITEGPDGNMWFTDSGANFFGSISPSGATIHTYHTLQAGGTPRGIAAGPDGNLYICDPGNNEIYVESTLGIEINRQQVHTASARPYEIVNGGDGYLYFTEFTAAFGTGSGQIGVITPSPYAVKEIPTPNNTIGPLGIGLGPDQHVWFTEYGNGDVGQLTGSGPTTAIKEFNVSSGRHGPSGLTLGYDRKLWLAMDGAASTLERFDTTTHAITSYALPTAGESAYEVITGPDGNLWYTTQANRIGRLELSQS